ncbi:LacI family DNA-binding transcriptional regulator [Kribbella monticola]|uniref:LacI family DNA-binding transcriptional regulator n=1 Tax=Kribbella monticola TaxID=2185285 RepID=UPI0018E5A8D0|nr:LacI family DNA-binding transcriptional regulator [Kribbella monticola]
MSASASRPPVMADVARVAGVSHQTVSRVLNNLPNVRPSTRDRILQAIDELGYRRNLTARALVTRHSRVLGVVSFDTTLFGPASTVHGIEQAARDAGYFISIVSLKAITRDSVEDAIHHLAGQGIDGIVVVAPQRQAARALSSIPDDIPAVAVEGGRARRVPVVSVDQVGGARLAVQHLLELGHQTVWHIAGPEEWLEAEGRLKGWQETLEAAGRPVPTAMTGDWSPRSGYEAGLRLPSSATAVFVANDQMALGLLRSLSERGVRVPDDVSVVGFDDVPEAEFFSPPLTTVRQDFTLVGRYSIELLLEQLAEDPPARRRRVVVPATLVRRRSTAAPAGA